MTLTTAQSGGDAQGDILSHIENVTGSSFNDILRGDAGEDVLSGCGGNDLLIGGAGADTLDGGAGTDTASYCTSLAAVTIDLGSGHATGGDAQGDTLIGIENLTGSGCGDVLTGDAGANQLDGGLGDDTIEGGAGNDILIGGAGTDTASYEHAEGGVRVSLAVTAAQKTGGAGTDTLSGFENLIGSAFNDTLTGNSGDNLISGGNGADVLTGGGGGDALVGGAGDDQFRFTNAADGNAMIVDLDNTTEHDTIGIQKSGFGIERAVSLNGNDAFDFAQHYFVGGNGPVATETGHGQFLYDSATSQLFWDDDGQGAHTATLIATLSNHAELHASDFDLR